MSFGPHLRTVLSRFDSVYLVVSSPAALHTWNSTPRPQSPHHAGTLTPTLISRTSIVSEAPSCLYKDSNWVALHTAQQLLTFNALVLCKLPRLAQLLCARLRRVQSLLLTHSPLASWEAYSELICFSPRLRKLQVQLPHTRHLPHSPHITPAELTC